MLDQYDFMPHFLFFVTSVVGQVGKSVTIALLAQLNHTYDIPKYFFPLCWRCLIILEVSLVNHPLVAHSGLLVETLRQGRGLSKDSTCLKTLTRPWDLKLIMLDEILLSGSMASTLMCITALHILTVSDKWNLFDLIANKIKQNS